MNKILWKTARYGLKVLFWLNVASWAYNFTTELDEIANY